MDSYLDDLFTPAVLAVQQRKGANGAYPVGASGPNALSEHEVAHITASDSFYLSTVSESGWPYTQHKGGDTGFVKVLGPTTIGWAERNGNRQYLGSGNIDATGRIAAIFVDYPTRTRLKIRGNATYHPEPSAELRAALGADDLRIDGAVTVDVVATDWNCPKYITPRFTEAEIQQAVAPLQQRIAELEANQRH